MTTSKPGIDPDIKNGIGKAIVDRIIRAHAYEKFFFLIKFKSYII